MLDQDYININTKYIMRNVIIIVLFCSIVSSCNNECYNIREWKVQFNEGKNDLVTDTLELSDTPLNKVILDSLVEKNAKNFRYNQSYFYIEASKPLVWNNDTIIVTRMIQNGNLTFYYTKPFGVVMMYYPRIKNLRLSKITNSCTKRTISTDGFINSIDKDTILNPPLPDVKLEDL